MTEMQNTACRMIDVLIGQTPGSRKIGEVLKEICRESHEAAMAVWKGMWYEGKLLKYAKEAVMEYMRKNEGVCTREDAKRILREMYGVPAAEGGAEDGVSC